MNYVSLGASALHRIEAAIMVPPASPPLGSTGPASPPLGSTGPTRPHITKFVLQEEVSGSEEPRENIEIPLTFSRYLWKILLESLGL